ncbi:Large proline-rich protein bag6-B, partial [Orchesella cincta]
TTPPTTNPSTTTTTTQAAPQNPAGNQNASAQQFPNNPMAGINITGGMLPPGLQNLGALLGMGGAGMVNIFGGPGGPISMPIGPGGLGQVPGFNMRSNNNNNAGNQQQQVPGGSDQNTPPTPTPTPTANSGNSTPRRQGGVGTESNNNNNAGGGMFGNLQQLRNELTRSQYDMLMPCSTHHTSGRSRANRTRPADFHRFVNVDTSENSSSATLPSAEGEAVNIIMDLIRHSRLIDMLQPVFKDVVLNYLMRGRDPKNEAHVRTCAKGLVKKLLPFFEKFSNKLSSKDESVDISATYSNILTDFLANLMQRILGQTPGGDGHFKLELLNSITRLQKQLIQALKLCYPSCGNVGLLFVNYVVENCVGGMSVLFKEQVRHQLVEHLKEIEKKSDTIGTTAVIPTKPSFVVYKTTAPPPSSSTVSDLSPPSTSAPLKTPPASAALDAAPIAPPKKPSLSTTTYADDVDIDEVLQMPTSMATTSTSPQQQNHNAPRRGWAAQGHSNQTDSIASHMRNLPSEWLDTLLSKDVRRQVEMPPQPAFSPGYNTLFPRKH